MGKGPVATAAVLLNEARLRSARTYGRALRNMLPGVPISTLESSDELRALKVGDGEAYFPILPPLPWNELEPHVRNAWHWKDSRDLLRAHKAHILVTLRLGPEDPLERAMLLSRLVATVLSSQECVGVYWSGPAISPAGMFLESVRKAVAGGDYPLLSWVSFGLALKESGVSVVSEGMEELGHKELEVIAHPDDSSAFPYTLALCDYVLKKGPILRHGETIGRTPSERFPIVHRPWRWDKAREAIEIDMRKCVRKPKGIFGKLFGT
jgi:hypothetical protein